MTIDWQNATFEYLDSEASNFEPEEQKYSLSKSFQEQKLNTQYHPVKRSRNEFEEYSIKLEEFTFEDNPEPQNNNNGTKFHQKKSEQKLKNKINSVYACTTCTLDFPSIAYLDRHQRTKKHLRALEMEERGRKVNQKRSYVRRNKYQGNPVAHQVFEGINQEITDLTPEEIQLLHKFDMQLLKIDSENTAKDFYENFNFDLDLEIKEPAAKIQKLSSPQEIYDDIISYEPMIKEEPQDPKVVAVRSLARPQIQDPVPKVNVNQLISKPMSKEPMIPKISAVYYIRPNVQYPGPNIQNPFPNVQSQVTAVNFGESTSQNAIIPIIEAIQSYARPQHSIQQSNKSDEPSTSKEITNNEPMIKEELIDPSKIVALPINVNSHMQHPIPTIKAANVSQELIKHYEAILKEQPIIQCELCLKTFNKRCYYTQHMNSAHSEGKIFKCEKCGKKFSELVSLEIHLTRHSGDKAFKCNKCEKSYNNKSDLVRHDKTHEDIRDFYCNTCGKGFIRNDQLHRHEMTHNADRNLKTIMLSEE